MRFYVGCEVMPVPNWQDILPPVQAPANYRDKEKIAAFIADMTAKLEQGDAAKSTLTGVVNRAVIITPGAAGDKSAPDSSELLTENGQPKIIFDESGPMAGPGALDCMMDAAEIRSSSELENLAVFGIYIQQHVRLMALQYINTGLQLPFRLHWTVDFDSNFSYNCVPGFIDPLQVLFGARKFSATVDPIGAGKRLGLPVDPQDAESMAVFAFQLSKRLGM